jgi:S-adenosylmethionine:tRNA ribosyltransferase-isomerase
MDLNDIKAYDYWIPPELIAQNPSLKRDGCRLMRFSRATGETEDRRFFELPRMLRPGDLLVMNDASVFRARVLGKKIPGGAASEIFFLSPIGENVWRAFVRPGRKLPPGSRVDAGGAVVEIGERLDGGCRAVRVPDDAGDAFFETRGTIPLPPYIKRSSAPEERYQTVYRDRAKCRSVASPTAGLHFTPELLRELAGAGVETEFLTLDVGAGTFRPVKAEDIREHEMHRERCEIGERCASRVNEAKAEGRRVIAVGTTVVRTLESMAEGGGVRPGAMETGIFITPGYEFKIPDAMITNFHLPKSTLLMLVAAYAGHEATMRAYARAVEKGYNFFSFGDAMLIE